MYFLLFIAMLFGSMFLSMSLTVFFHEIGHAVALLLFTRKPVKVYVGSHGSVRKTVRLNLLVFTIWLHYNPFDWFRKGGLCIPAPVPVSRIQQLIITLSGPLASVLIACVSLYITFHYDLHGFLKLFFIAFVPAAAIDLFRGLYADPTPVKLDDGSMVHNDAHYLRRTVKQMRYGKLWDQAISSAEAKQYQQAIEQTSLLLQKGYTDSIVYQLHISCLIETRAYETALLSFEDYMKQHPPDATDHLLLGIIHGFLNNRETSLQAFDEALTLEPSYAEALNNKGYFLGEWGQLEESLS
ncbi:MAG: hypothetical protein EOO97_00605, partial [Pedobacter sp.]